MSIEIENKIAEYYFLTPKKYRVLKAFSISQIEHFL